MQLDADLLGLPGPRRLWRRLADVVEAGTCLAIACPTAEIAQALEMAMAAQRELRGWDVTIVDLAGFLYASTVVEAAYDVLHLDRPPAGARIDERTLLEHHALGRRVVWIDATQAAPGELNRWWPFVTTVGAVSRAMPLGRRCIFVTATLDGALPGLPDGGPVARLWWWGVLRPLDVAIWVAEIGGDALDRSAAGCAVELGAFDLELVERLVGERNRYWHGDVGYLAGLLDEYWSERGHPPCVSVDGVLATAERPPPELVDAWRIGTVEWWQGRPVAHPALAACPGDQDSLAVVLWQGQLPVLLPRIERHRQRLARWLLARAEQARRRGFAEELTAEEDPLALEVGPLAWHAHQLRRAGVITQEQLRYADLLRLARNDLAHRRPVHSHRLMNLGRLAVAEPDVFSLAMQVSDRRAHTDGEKGYG